jgi:tetratricopeptide (TPR) repeat protein
MLNSKNNSGRFLITVVLSFVLSSFTCPASPREEAAEAFAKGDFPAAVRGYETAIAVGSPSAGLYENLATAQIRAGQRPQAVLSLYRAVLLDPNGLDARMALSDLERSLGVPRPPSDWKEFVAEKLPLRALVIVGCSLAWLGAFLILVIAFKSRSKFWPSVAAGVCLIGGGALAAAGFLADPRFVQRDSAVLMTDEPFALLAAPADQSETLASLPGGATVKILRKSGDWVFAQTPSGIKGWVPTKALEAIVPSS